jgi:hypothetical protein
MAIWQYAYERDECKHPEENKTSHDHYGDVSAFRSAVCCMKRENVSDSEVREEAKGSI